MKKDLFYISIIVLILLGGYYLISIVDPGKIQQIIIALIAAIPVYYLLVRRKIGNSSQCENTARRKLSEKPMGD